MMDKSNPEDELLKMMGMDALQGDERQQALETILTTLYLSLGDRLVNLLNLQQSEEFEDLIAKDDIDYAEVHAWLQKNVPDYVAILDDEVRMMKADLQESKVRLQSKLHD